MTIMNNKKGGWGTTILIVLILMIASAVGGAYAYRVIDGQMAVRDAKKSVEAVDISDYDTAEQNIIQGYIDETTKDLDNAKTRKEVYEILGDFINHVDKVQTKKDKELEQALKDAEEAKKLYNNQRNSSDTSDSGSGYADDLSGSGNSGSTGSSDTSGYSGSGGSSDDSDSSSYKSNSLGNTGDGDEEEDDNKFLGSLLGGMSSSSSGN